MITTTLAAFPSPAQGVWHLTIPFLDITIPLRAYALFIILGIVAALMIGDRRWAARGGERGVIYDIALWAVPFGLIGGRLYHVMTDWKTYFGEGGAGPAAALRIWDGGLGIWGAVALGGVGAWIACRRRGIPLPAFGDAVAPGIVLAQAIGRLGNYFNQELYGRETTVPWGMQIFYRQDSSGIIDVHSLNGVSTGQVAAVVHPTFLYELLWNVLVFIILIYVDRRFKMGHGRLFALYVAGYCVGRFCVELLRDDVATHLAGIRINSFTSTFVFIGAVVYIVLAPKGREDPATLRGTAEVDGDAAAADVESSELVKELAAVAATTGVVAAAAVAGREDEPEPEPEATAEPETGPVADADVDDEADADAEADDEPEPEPEPDAEIEAAPESESGAEVEVAETEGEEAEVEAAPEPEAAPGPEAEAEPESVTEAAPAVAALQDSADSSTEVVETPEPEADEEPESELAADPEPGVTTAEESTTDVAAVVVEPDSASTEDGEAANDAADSEEPADDEAIVEAEVAAPGVAVLTEVEAEDADLIDEDHDPLDGDPEDFDSLDDAIAVVSSEGPQSEQAEEIAESDAEAELESDAQLESDPDAESDPEVESDDEVEVAAEPEDEPEPVESAESTESVEPAAAEPVSPPRRRWWRRG